MSRILKLLCFVQHKHNFDEQSKIIRWQALVFALKASSDTIQFEMHSPKASAVCQPACAQSSTKIHLGLCLQYLFLFQQSDHTFSVCNMLLPTLCSLQFRYNFKFS